MRTKPLYRLRPLFLTTVLALLGSNATAVELDGGVRALHARSANQIIGLDGRTPLELPRPVVDSQAAVAQLLAKPLNADAAVRIALLNNPGLQTLMGAEGLSITDGTSADDPAKLRAQRAMTVLSAQVTKAWVNAVAAQASAALMREASDTAQTSGTLMRRMVQAGNVSKLTQAQHQLLVSQAAVALARAEQAAFAAREQLSTLLGLWGVQTQYTLPAALPALPQQAQEMNDVEARAIQARDELALARSQWQQKSRGMPPNSPDARWDAMGDAARLRAQAVALRSQARSAYYAYRSSWDIAHHLQTEVLPLRKFVQDELVLRYNGMLTSLLDVLADSQAQTLAANSALLALRDFHLAHTDLQALLAGAPLEQLGSNPTAGAADSNPGSAAAH